MQDRISENPGRVLITPENGPAYYATMTRADNPTQKGTPLNKASLLKDATAALFGLSSDSVPDDVFGVLSRFQSGLGNEYVWGKTAVTTTEEYATEESVTGLKRVVRFGSERTLYIADSVSVAEDGTVSLVSQTTVSVPASGDRKTPTEQIIGKYFVMPEDTKHQFWNGAFWTNTVYRCADDATIVQSSESGNYFYEISGDAFEIVGHAKVVSGEFMGYVNSPDPNAYPVDDGYTYTALGQLGNKVQIATGSYTGTGTYGASNPNSLTFDFVPRLIIIYGTHSQQTTANSPMFLINGHIGVRQSVQTPGQWQPVTVTWGNKVSWSSIDANHQQNISGYTYAYIAIG